MRQTKGNVKNKNIERLNKLKAEYELQCSSRNEIQ